MHKPTNVTPDILYDALARFGPAIASQLGYFNALTSSNTVDVQVTAPVIPVYDPEVDPTPDIPTCVFPPHYGYGELDLSAYKLTALPTLSGVVIDPIDGVSTYGVNFMDVTTTSAKVHSYYGLTADSVERETLPTFSQTVRVRIN